MEMMGQGWRERGFGCETVARFSTVRVPPVPTCKSTGDRMETMGQGGGEGVGDNTMETTGQGG